MSVRRWDAVVVGAGPAGSATAAWLARAGHEVLLLDRHHFPRAKPCGECVNPAAVAALRRLGALHRLAGEAAEAVRGWRIHPWRAAPFAGAFPAGQVGMGVSRVVLDSALLEHAAECGATVRTGCHVTDLVREGGLVVGVRVAAGREGEMVRARLVIGADGLRSTVVRRLGLIRRAPRLRKVALTAHVRGAADLDGRGELHLFAWGCVGVAAVGGGVANVVVVVAGGKARAVAGAKAERFDWLMREVPCLTGARRVEEVLATGPFDWPTRGAVAAGALVVGDAAGYYDPFTGQGIYRALRGAELAADAADRVLRRSDGSAMALAGYEVARREFLPGERLQRALETFVSHPRLLASVAPRLGRRPVLVDALLAATGDLHPVSTLLRPRLLAALLR